jgi:hypothetical protein
LDGREKTAVIDDIVKISEDFALRKIAGEMDALHERDVTVWARLGNFLCEFWLLSSCRAMGSSRRQQNTARRCGR